MSQKDPAEKAVRDIRRKTRKRYSAEDKIRIVLSGLRGEESIAALCRRVPITVIGTIEVSSIPNDRKHTRPTVGRSRSAPPNFYLPEYFPQAAEIRKECI